MAVAAWFGDGAVPGGPGVTTPILIERVGDARIMRSLDRRFGLDEEALRAARRWRFKPGLLNGKPVPVTITIELMFTVR
jgi:outer membrane biosynthesis protein TonB